jgi:hypothetical protein
MICRSFDDFVAVLSRIAGCLNAKSGNFKVHELFMMNGERDFEAITLLTEMLKSRFVKNDVLDIQCHITFQLSGKEKEVVVCPASEISEEHIRIIWHRWGKQVDDARNTKIVRSKPTKSSKRIITRNKAACSLMSSAVPSTSTISLSTVLSTPSTISSETILTPPSTPDTTDVMYVMKKRKGLPIVDRLQKNERNA